MDYKTILVHASSGAGAKQRIRLAAVLARHMAAHLVGSAPTGVSRFIPPAALAAGGPAVAARCGVLRRAAEEALVRFERIVAEEGVDSFESRRADDDVDAALALEARYCDLVVVERSSAGADAATPPLPQDLPEYLVLTSGRPVLIVPAEPSLPSLSLTSLGQGAIVAWDGGVAAARAVAGALPLLRAAGPVTVLGFDDGDEAADAGSGIDACEQLAASLRRQGIAAHAASRATDGDVGAELLAAAADSGAGLLVMGGYGHARFRELVLGGATRTVLAQARLPVLMAH